MTDAHDAVSTAIAGRHAKVLRPVGAMAPRSCSADKTARVLRTIRPTDPVATRRRQVVVESGT